MSIRHARMRAASRSTALRALGVLALVTGLSAGIALPAQAAGPALSAAPMVLGVAQQEFGVPYRWGGQTPAGFDCSGYTKWVFGHAGVALPHSANGQMLASDRVSAAAAVPGDLVFFVKGGHAYHTGIYAGNGTVYDAPGKGRAVTSRKIWTSAVVYGRVL